MRNWKPVHFTVCNNCHSLCLPYTFIFVIQNQSAFLWSCLFILVFLCAWAHGGVGREGWEGGEGEGKGERYGNRTWAKERKMYMVMAGERREERHGQGRTGLIKNWLGKLAHIIECFCKKHQLIDIIFLWPPAHREFPVSRCPAGPVRTWTWDTSS